MTNTLTTTPTYHANLPAFLRSPDVFQHTNTAIAGIGGGAPPSISIRASRFHLIDPNGEELLVNQLHLDVIVLTGNEHLSKIYYAGQYDPARDNSTPPTCFSDNGQAPSQQAATPQAALCANCPHNAWGSKTTPAGAKVKACGDYKKLAVVLAADTQIVSATNAAGVSKAFEKIYLLRVPGGSLSTWRDYARDIHGRGVPIIGVVTRLAFDPQKSHPALLFAASAFIDEPGYRRIEKLPTSAEALAAIGANDQPRSVGAAMIGALPAPVAPVPVVPLPAAAVLPPAPAPTNEVVRQRGRPRSTTVAPAPAPAPAPASIFASASGSNGAIVQPTPAPPDLDAQLTALLSKAQSPGA